MSERTVDGDRLCLPAIDGRHRLVRALGTGRTGTVYLAEIDGGSRIALKVLARELSDDEDFVRAFHRQAAGSAQLSTADPALARCFEYGQAPDGRLYVVMEHVEGRALADILAEEGPLDVARTVHLAIQLARALQVLHANLVVHGDVRPRNVLVLEGDEVKLIGYELATLGASRAVLRLTWDRQGAAAYTAPEQIGWYNASPETDVYALGVVLYEMLCGAPPFSGEGPAEVLAKQLGDLPVPLRRRRRDLPRRLERTIMQMLEKDLEKRPPLAAVAAILLAAAADSGADSAIGAAGRALVSVAADLTERALSRMASPALVTLGAALVLGAAVAAWSVAPGILGPRSGGPGGPVELGVRGGQGHAATDVPAVLAPPDAVVEETREEERLESPAAAPVRAVRTPSAKPARRIVPRPAAAVPRPPVARDEPPGNDPTDARGVIEWLIREHQRQP